MFSEIWLKLASPDSDQILYAESAVYLFFLPTQTIFMQYNLLFSNFYDVLIRDSGTWRWKICVLKF